MKLFVFQRSFWSNLRGSLWHKERMTHVTSSSHWIWHGHFWESSRVSYSTVSPPRPSMPSTAVRQPTETGPTAFFIVFWHEIIKGFIFVVWWFFCIRGGGRLCNLWCLVAAVRCFSWRFVSWEEPCPFVIPSFC